MFDICAIGNACIDIVARVDDAFLSSWGFPKSICTYLTLERANLLQDALTEPAYIPGGCAANTAAVISALGGCAAFIGKVANDDIGRLFLKDMADRRIHYAVKPDPSLGAGSTRIFALTTPDAERTFAAYYGVQETLSPDDLDEDAVRQSACLYLDGYALNSRRGAEAFLKAADMAHESGAKVAFSPSDLSILLKFGDTVRDIAKKADIFLCNQQEACAFTQSDTLHQAMEILTTSFSFGAVTMGAEGVQVFDGRSTLHHLPCSSGQKPAVDLNGAGDGFAGGFLYGVIKKFPVERAALLGNLCAERIISHTGARAKGDYAEILRECE